ncbi:MAG: hypothetical protein ACREGE_01065 [Candidatus Microsaccharimonas sp.]
MSHETSPISTLSPTQARLEILAENARNIVKVPDIVEELRERLGILFDELITDGYEKIGAEHRGLVGEVKLKDVVVRDATWKDATPFQRFLEKLGFRINYRLLQGKKVQPLAVWEPAWAEAAEPYRYIHLYLSADDGAVYMMRGYGTDIVPVDFEHIKQACNYAQALKLLESVNDRIDSVVSHREHVARMAELDAQAEAARQEREAEKAQREAEWAERDRLLAERLANQPAADEN